MPKQPELHSLDLPNVQSPARSGSHARPAPPAAAVSSTVILESRRLGGPDRVPQRALGTLADELESLQARIGELEQLLEGALAASRKKGVTESEPLATKASEKGLCAIGAERRQRMIQEIAYAQSEQRGFVGGDPDADWTAAEMVVDRILTMLSGAED